MLRYRSAFGGRHGVFGANGTPVLETQRLFNASLAELA